MSEYIQWFVEEILNQKYIESESLKLWKMEKIQMLLKMSLKYIMKTLNNTKL